MITKPSYVIFLFFFTFYIFPIESIYYSLYRLHLLYFQYLLNSLHKIIFSYFIVYITSFLTLVFLIMLFIPSNSHTWSNNTYKSISFVSPLQVNTFSGDIQWVHDKEKPLPHFQYYQGRIKSMNTILLFSFKLLSISFGIWETKWWVRVALCDHFMEKKPLKKLLNMP